jgi:hypothetical protein
MSRLREMGTLIERCKRRADKEGDDFISNAEWRALISEVWGTDIFGVAADTGYRYFETRATLTTDGTAYVAEPSNMLSVVRVDYVDGSGRHRELTELTTFEEGLFAGSSGANPACFFTHVDDRFYFYPTPPTGQAYEVLYIPQAPDLSEFANSDCVDLVTMDGEACLYWGAAALALAKAKQDCTLHLQKQELHRTRHMEWCATKAIAQPRRRSVRLDDVDFARWDPAEWMPA